MNLKLSVKTFREVGLEARWTKTNKGRPIIVVRNPLSRFDHQRKTWWMVTKRMWHDMQNDGVVAGFDRNTLLGDIFSLPA